MVVFRDGAGSMSQVLSNNVKHILNLVEFCRKVNIPYDVYFFTSERRYDRHNKKDFSKNIGEYVFEDFSLVNCLSHRMNKKQADLALKMMFHMGKYFDNRYTRRSNDFYSSEQYEADSNNWGIPSK